MGVNLPHLVPQDVDLEEVDSFHNHLSGHNAVFKGYLYHGRVWELEYALSHGPVVLGSNLGDDLLQ